MNYVISVGMSALSAILVFIIQGLMTENKRLREEHKENAQQHNKNMSMGLVCLLRIQLITYHERYMSEGSISLNALSNWKDLRDAYYGLGGNGMVPGMDKEIKALPIKKKETD